MFRLRRYNGKSHVHTNRIEKEKSFYDFHIHEATELYQQHGMREDAFARPTQRYNDYQSALVCLFEDGSLTGVPQLQLGLFGGP